MGEVLIAGIGNPSRADDGAGWTVIDRLEQCQFSNITLSKQQGDIAKLLEQFSSHSTVYLIDACQLEAPLSTWFRIDALKNPIPHNAKQTSTHGFTLSEAIELAKNLGQLPNKLIVYAIVGHDFSMHEGLSPSVLQATDAVYQAITQEIEKCMKKA